MTPRSPNILFLFPDQHRHDWLGSNPRLPLRTPHLDTLARRGVRFSHCITPSPLCAPARACLATGLDYASCRVPGNADNLPLDLPTYYQRLRDRGYHVGGVGKFDLHKGTLDWGPDGTRLLAEWGFACGIDNAGKGDAVTAYRSAGRRPADPYMRYLAGLGLAEPYVAMYDKHGRDGRLNFPAVSLLPPVAYGDNWITRNALDVLADIPTGEPWHLVVNWIGPHGPFDVTAEMRARWEAVDLPPPIDGDPTDADTLARQQNYAAMIENIDARVGDLLAAIEARGDLENTLVVYASDHGEMLGDHGRWGKSVWYHPSTGVPLIVAGPGVSKGVSSEALVSLHDLTATFLDYAQAETLPGMGSRSLRPLLEGHATAHRDAVRSTLGSWDMLYDGQHKLVRRLNEPDLLYDLVGDPAERHNIAGERAGVVARLTERMSWS